jgi:hypothetical protein
MPSEPIKYALKDAKGINGGIGCLVWGVIWTTFFVPVGYWYCDFKFCDDTTPVGVGGILLASIVTAAIHFFLKWENLSQLERQHKRDAEKHPHNAEKRKYDTGKNERTRARADAASTRTESRKRSSYEVLGIQVGASLDEIKSAYKKAAQHYHPDKVSHLAPEFQVLAEKSMREINAAYEELKNSTDD